MDSLIQDYNNKKDEIKKRLKEFKSVKGDDIFYELCFCLLTPQSSGLRADQCIQELKKKDFFNRKVNPKPILKRKIRFHNNKTLYLLNAKKIYSDVLSILNDDKDIEEKREILLNKVKGFGWKEVNHFLRNIGYENLAILDRHILKNLKEYDVIKEIPKTLTKKTYLDIETKFREFSKKVKIPMDELDLLFWAQETGVIFK